jgi:hypothetical protein
MSYSNPKDLPDAPGIDGPRIPTLCDGIECDGVLDPETGLCPSCDRKRLATPLEEAGEFVDEIKTIVRALRTDGLELTATRLEKACEGLDELAQLHVPHVPNYLSE